ncbi:MAG: flavodoxin domain-containing protein [Myxococcota bacterium]
MAKALVLYATTEGQTAKVAHHIADVARGHGHEVAVHTAEEALDGKAPPLDGFDVVFVGGSLHEGRHQRSLRRFLREHGQELAAKPTGLFSLSLAAASADPEERKAADHCIDELLKETGFTPTVRASVAGALRYTQYSWLKRFVMKRIAASEGGETDTSKDFEYTDWDAVTAFADEVLAKAPS